MINHVPQVPLPVDGTKAARCTTCRSCSGCSGGGQGGGGGGTAQAFSDAYVEAFGVQPSPIWDLDEAEGGATD
jgi:hypothetical protein